MHLGGSIAESGADTLEKSWLLLMTGESIKFSTQSRKPQFLFYLSISFLSFTLFATCYPSHVAHPSLINAQVAKHTGITLFLIAALYAPSVYISTFYSNSYKRD
ncbi:hypothetical protein L204_102138 [Cryptococcus depauperatus]